VFANGRIHHSLIADAARLRLFTGPNDSGKRVMKSALPASLLPAFPAELARGSALVLEG
jgi:hypothetical protein